MGLISTQAEVVVGGSNVAYYDELGYSIPKYKNIRKDMVVKHGTKIMVNINDLTDCSRAQVNVVCDGINCITPVKENITWKNYLKHVREDGQYFCNQCANTLQGKTYYDTCSYEKKLSKMGNGIKLQENSKFISTKTKMIHICPICNCDWDVRPSDVLKGHSMCDKCNSEKHESVMATTLKQVLKYYYAKTEWEYDLGFRGLKNGVSKYDIFIPELNTVIECQSRYHDTLEQQIIDSNKKEYAIFKGYKYVSIDARNYSVLQVIQMFFPNIKEIPNYIDIKKDTIKTYEYEEVQNLLNKGCTYKDISDLLNIRYEYVRQIIFVGKLSKPKTHYKSNYKRIICVNTKEIFYSAKEILIKKGIDDSSIIKCCRGKSKSAGKHLITGEKLIWMYYEEYLEL